MKRLIARSMVAALIVAAAATPVFALGLSAGFKAGLCIADLSGEIVGLANDFTSRNGFSGGVFLDMRLSNMISVQAEAIYMQRGAWVKDMPFIIDFGTEIIQGTADTELRLWYFDFPVLAKFTFRRDSFLSPFVYTGPVLSYSQRSIVEITINIPGFGTWGERDDVSDQIKDWDFGAVFGGGLNLNFGSFLVFFEGRYSLGLKNLNDTEDESDIKNRAIAVLAGLSIPFPE